MNINDHVVEIVVHLPSAFEKSAWVQSEAIISNVDFLGKQTVTQGMLLHLNSLHNITYEITLSTISLCHNGFSFVLLLLLFCCFLFPSFSALPLLVCFSQSSSFLTILPLLFLIGLTFPVSLFLCAFSFFWVICLLSFFFGKTRTLFGFDWVDRFCNISPHLM